MRGYEVVASDKRRVGRVVDVRNSYLIVESGRLRRFRRPVPREFVHVVDEAAQVFVTVPRRVLQDAPAVDRKSNFDLGEAARHYGLAEAYVQGPSEGGRQPPEHRRAELRKQMRPRVPTDLDYAYRSPALFGDRHWDGRRVKDD